MSQPERKRKSMMDTLFRTESLTQLLLYKSDFTYCTLSQPERKRKGMVDTLFRTEIYTTVIL